MNKILKYFFAVVLVASSTLAWADTFYFNYYYPPGGGTEQWSNPLITGLQNKGHIVRQEFFKSCHEAITKTSTQPNGFIVAGPDILPDVSGKCPAQKDFPQLKLLTNLAAYNYYLCTSPKKTHITLADLSGSQIYKVAISASPSAVTEWTNFITNSTIKNNIRTIPYEAQAAARAALIAGTDVDLMYVATGVEHVISAGGKCLAASSIKNHYNLPALSQLSTGKYTEQYVTIDLWTMHPQSKDNINLLTEILKSSVFKDFLAQRTSSVHLGIGR